MAKPTIFDLLGIPEEEGGAVSLPVAVERGLPIESLERLAGELKLSPEEFAQTYLGISRTTLARRRKRGVLNLHESDAIVRYAKLLILATEFMKNDSAAALRWLNTPLAIFQRRTPMEHARIEAGACEVEVLVHRLEHGVFS